MVIKRTQRTFLFILMLFVSQSIAISSQSALTQEDVAVELLGNPFAERYADESMYYARNIWTMFVFDGRIYFGGGNSSNSPPAANAGPVDVWSYDPETEQFNREYTVEEEQLDSYTIYNETLFIPGYDEMDGVNVANIYRLEADGWKQYRTVPGALHVFDLYEYEGRLFTGIGNAGGGTNDVALVSDDGGMKWNLIPANPTFHYQNETYSVGFMRGWDYFEVADQLYLNVLSVDPIETSSNLPSIYPAVLRYDGEHLVVAETNFFPGMPNAIGHRIIHATEFGDQTVYIGAETVNGSKWQSFALYAVNDRLQVQNLLPDRDLQFWDILADGDNIYVLAGQEIEDGWEVSVMNSRDLVSWETLVSFTAATYARSFVRFNDDYYFGLGCNTDKQSAACGDILRVSG